MNSQEALRLLSENQEDLRRKFDVRDLAIFGSVARNQYQPGSDIDVLVEFSGQPTFDNFMGLKLYLEELFGSRVDLVTERTLRPEIRPYVERELIRVP